MALRIYKIYKKTLRNGSCQSYPLKTEPLPETIYEAAKEHFYGSKSNGEVTEIIRNRVPMDIYESDGTLIPQ